MRTLILSPNYEKRYNRVFEDFRAELARQTPVVFWGHGHRHGPKTSDLRRFVANQGRFDLVLVCHLKYHENLAHIIREIPCPKGALVVDYLRRNQPHRDRILDTMRADYAFLNQTHSVQACCAAKRIGTLWAGIHAVYLPFSVDSHKFSHNVEIPRTWDASAVFSTVPQYIYHKREAVISALERLSNRLRIKAARANRTHSRITGKAYTDLLINSKIVVCTTSSCKCVTLRHFEAAAAGALVLTDTAPDLERLGFVDGKTTVLYNGIADMIEKVKYYSDDAHEAERIAITTRARSLILERHTCTHRAAELLSYTKRQNTGNPLGKGLNESYPMHTRA